MPNPYLIFPDNCLHVNTEFSCRWFYIPLMLWLGLHKIHCFKIILLVFENKSNNSIVISRGFIGSYLEFKTPKVFTVHFNELPASIISHFKRHLAKRAAYLFKILHPYISGNWHSTKYQGTGKFCLLYQGFVKSRFFSLL